MGANRNSIASAAASKIGIPVEDWQAKTEQGLKWCYCCRAWKPAENFGTDRTRSSRLASACKTCVSHKGTASRYGVSVEKARDMRLEGGICPICKRHRKLEVDHDHGTGEIRGYLCTRCNGGLGRFADNVALLKRAITYLEGKWENSLKAE